VYKDTINITSAAFKTLDEDYIKTDNIGKEEYAYEVGFRSTSNVRADEFTVIDPMENAKLEQVRITQLWTPVSVGDTDGYFNLWYQTNMTNPYTQYSDANAMDTNPYNPNNPDNVQKYPSLGWQLWQEKLSTTKTTHLLVSDLKLVQGEYITGLRYEYGSVEVGFSTDIGEIPMQQTWKSDLNWQPIAGSGKEQASQGAAKDESPSNSVNSMTAYDASSTDKSNVRPNAASEGTTTTSLYPAYYLVVCPEALEPPTEIQSSATAHIARNFTLTDKRADEVITRTIASFFTAPHSDSPTPFEFADGSLYETMPPTSDIRVNLTMLFALTSLATFAVFITRSLRRKYIS
jgi:hypothetical protein